MDLTAARIWIVTDQPPTSGVGAYAIALYRLLRPGLPGLRLVDAHYFPHAAPEEASPVAGLETTGRFWSAPATVRANYRRLAELASEVDLWHLAGTHYSLARGRVPAVATVHDLYTRRPTAAGLRDPRQLSVEVYSYLLNLETRRELARCAALVSISETTRQALERSTGLGSHLVRHWADEERFHTRDSSVARQRLGLPLGPTLILNVGSSSFNKNVGRLAEIAERLNDGYLVIKVGSPPSRAHRRIQWLGRLDKDDYPLVFGACDAYLHISSYEGFGRPLLEALASGLPIVSTDAPAAPEVLADAALFVGRPYSAESFADAIRRATAEPLRTSLRERALRRAGAFSADVARDRYEAIYRAVLASR